MQHKEYLNYSSKKNPIDLSNIHEFATFDPEKIQQRSIFLQDLATRSSTLGAGAEIGMCIASASSGSGCIPGFIAGSAFHNGITNPIENVFSFFSFGETYRYDQINDLSYIEDGTVVVDEALATSAVTTFLGNQIPYGSIDTIIDIYASNYVHGEIGGIYSIFELFTGNEIKGKIIDLGFFSIQFGQP